MVSWLSLEVSLVEKIDSIKILDERNMKLVLSKKFMIEPSVSIPLDQLNSRVLLHRKDLPSRPADPGNTVFPSELIETCGKLTKVEISLDKIQ